jgi:acetyl esterase/lipase
MFEKRIVFSLPGMERIAPRANVIYKTDGGGPLLADLYLPPATSTPAPIVIFIHGGVSEGMNPQPKDWGVFVSWGQLMAASGMAGVAFNHRMLWDNGFVPGSIGDAREDLRDLILFLREHAIELGIDADRICPVAFSAGGPLLVGPIYGGRSEVRCLAALYAYLGDTLPDRLDESEKYTVTDALIARRGQIQPMLIAKAGKDYPLINDSIDAFVKRAGEWGTSIEVLTHPEGVHGFDTENDDDTSRAIIRRVVEFIAGHLGA